MPIRIILPFAHAPQLNNIVYCLGNGLVQMTYPVIVHRSWVVLHLNANAMPLKEAYSNCCMKIYLTSKLTQYLTNIFKMRFLMRNCIKFAHRSQNGIFEKTCRATTVP